MEMEVRGSGKRRLEWDLNEWRWDGDLFIASSSSSSTTCSSHEHQHEDALGFNLGGPSNPNIPNIPTTTTTKVGGAGVVISVCQVQNCVADLSKAKDYHRRHKVCQIHSKSTHALVNNILQRFCQQCSRFHLLHEFDDGKRSCRRRLAGHNKRRRKTHPPPPPSPPGTPITNNLVLISLLNILSNIHSNNSSAHPDLVAQLLTTLANPSGLHKGKPISGVLLDSQITRETLDKRGLELQTASPQSPRSLFPINQSPPAAYSNTTQGRKNNMNNFDLNDIYVDSDDGMDDLERSPVTHNNASGSTAYPPWGPHDSHNSSPPQNSDSASGHSPSSSSEEAQSRTDRIVFKLFGKEPSEFPMALRGQILDWLAHTPTDVESYIRPGCIILTVYLRLADSMWEEMRSDLSSCLTRLLDTDDSFWTTGWVFVRVQNQIAFVHDGQVLLDKSLSLESSKCRRILSVVPLAVSAGEQAQFHVTGCSLSRSGTRLLCALEGKYLDQEPSQDVGEDGDCEDEDDIENANLTCPIPNVVGRGFIEVEDHGLSSSFFPFIVAEQDVCSDIRKLESVFELKENTEDMYEFNENSEARRQAMDFLNEMGWLLHRIQSKSRLGHLDPNTATFVFKRFRWLMDFSMDHDWCAVVKKLLDVWMTGSVGFGDHPTLNAALSEMSLLHRAVRRNCRSMVELLVGYVATTCAEELRSTNDGDYLFTPDAQGPGGLTPLHVAAGRDGSEEILDALTDDPRKIGVEAWKNARDSTGATPEDYARLRGHYSYIHLVQRKLKRSARAGGEQVVIDIPGESQQVDKVEKQFEIGSVAITCKQCDRKMGYYGNARTAMVYRPAMLSMVAVAAVCVCVALLFKSMPTVVCLFQPFRWESLNYGSS
ncbi:squamosa promoter-binding-like protein 1 [Silene latifolia]|uniref:squamosa promoter-binding-like protein 1 n=1 Tax=Silene latifolia TaxID=37657 RepID=UPI003D76E0F4